jgi:NAD(P)-dependent dehydrogenase (short-subunit alcohol dehydrogenase family)
MHKQHHCRIDLLFANAGGGESAPLGAITEAHVDTTFSVNVKGLLFTVQLEDSGQKRLKHRAVVTRKQSKGCSHDAGLQHGIIWGAQWIPQRVGDK